MKLLLLLIGPTFMILIGLTLFESVPLTFLLFYGWLLSVPLISKRNKSGNNYLSKFTKKKLSVIAGLSSGILCYSAIIWTFTLLLDSMVDLPSLRKMLVDWGFTGSQLIWIVLILILINPLLEEMYWREFMYTELFQRFGAVASILMTSCFYSLYHLLSVIPMFTFPLNIISVLPVFLAGVLWGYFRYKLNSIFASIISHILADIGIIIVYFLYISST